MGLPREQLERQRMQRIARQHRINGGPQIFAGDWDFILGTTAIKLATVDKLHVTIEQIKIGSACCCVGLGNALVGIVEVGERIPAGLLFLRHRLR